MASNRTRVRGRQVTLTPTNGGTNSGDPLLCGSIPGVSLNGGGLAPQAVDTLGVYALAVQGPVAQGDILYYTPGNTPKLSNSSGGTGATRFGYALAAIASAVVATIEVRLGY